ncbi:xylogen-like protein 11 [Ananas comosus]|uniref:Xylogen-like protein 11 n=1 Tax=Ananas comosus TaxID=4615 RepID=A0A6P5EQP4_ANACO|nr:xylogen-like protein 11 [Ananas comosus]
MSISKSPSISLLLGHLLLLPCTHAQEVPAVAAAAAAAAAAAPRASGLDCSEALLNLSACLTYVVQGSNLTRPKKGCCPALAGLINGEPICLCQLIAGYGGGSSGLGVQIDATRVLTLPTICRVDAPPTSLCAVLGVPVASVSPTSGGPEEAGINIDPSLSLSLSL